MEEDASSVNRTYDSAERYELINQILSDCDDRVLDLYVSSDFDGSAGSFLSAYKEQYYKYLLTLSDEELDDLTPIYLTTRYDKDAFGWHTVKDALNSILVFFYIKKQNESIPPTNLILTIIGFIIVMAVILLKFLDFNIFTLIFED